MDWLSRSSKITNITTATTRTTCFTEKGFIIGAQANTSWDCSNLVQRSRAPGGERTNMLGRSRTTGDTELAHTYIPMEAFMKENGSREKDTEQQL